MRANPAVIFNDGMLTDQIMTVETHVVPDRDVVLDSRSATYAHVIAYCGVLTDGHAMPGLHVVAQAAASIDDRVGTDDAVVTDHQGQLAGRCPSGGMPQNHKITDLHTVTDVDVRIDNVSRLHARESYHFCRRLLPGITTMIKKVSKLGLDKAAQMCYNNIR
jgi:hypothetical protein